jgi:aldose 1-epimerase
VLPTGESVEAWTLRGSGGVELEAATYGGIVTRLLVPDREGHPADIVLGFHTLEAYLAGHPYFGAITGRVAGRIADAQFFLDGKNYNLCRNDPPNHLHGGLCGFDKKVWKAAAVKRRDGAPSLRLSLCSPDGEEGYPGTVQVDVTYTVTNNNVFLIEANATTDRSTPFALTHHSYFNLAGEGANSVDEHELEVHADEIVPASVHMTPLGRLENVAGGGRDFRLPRRLGPAIPKLFQRHGDLYRLRRSRRDGGNNPLVPAARLVHPGSGRVLKVATTAPYLQVYTGAALDGSLVGKSGMGYGPHAGLCLECQRYSDGANTPEMGNTILRPGERLCESTAYAFSTTARKELTCATEEF